MLAGVSWQVTEGNPTKFSYLSSLISQKLSFAYFASLFTYSGETEDTFIADLSVGLATVSLGSHTSN